MDMRLRRGKCFVLARALMRASTTPKDDTEWFVVEEWALPPDRRETYVQREYMNDMRYAVLGGGRGKGGRGGGTFYPTRGGPMDIFDIVRVCVIGGKPRSRGQRLRVEHWYNYNRIVVLRNGSKYLTKSCSCNE